MYVVFLGDCNVDEYYTLQDVWPAVGSKANVVFEKKFCGGMTANACCLFAQYQNDAYLLTTLTKKDSFTQNILEDLHKYNVSTDHISFINSEKNTTTFIINDGKDHIIYILHNKADKNTQSDPLDMFTKSNIPLVKEAAFLYTTLPIIKQLPQSALLWESVQKFDVPVFLDVDSYALEKDIAILKNATIISINEHGVTNLFGNDTHTPKKIKQLFDNSVLKIILHTQGAEGATLYTKDDIIISLHNTHTDVQDATGAGDCFNATFLSYFLQNKDLKTCLQVANRAGAYAVSYKGPRKHFSINDVLNT